MKVSTKSWHYRVIDILDFCHPYNLCGYCWMTLWSLFIVAVVWPLAVVMGAFLVTMPIWHMFVNQDIAVTLIAGVIATVEIIALLFILRAIVSDRHAEEIYAGERDRPEPREPSLFYAWIKAQHDKVCPLIRFESE